jgi:hypothetical protein
LTHLDAVPDDNGARDFAINIYSRLVWTMSVMAVLSSIVLWRIYGHNFALAFMIGGTVSLVNFHWLRRTIERAFERTVSSEESTSSAGIVTRFLLRYVLIAIAAYVIFNSSSLSVQGLIAGLSLPAGAIMLEALYQIFRVLRHGF